VAEVLSKEEGVTVEEVSGRLGELSVLVNDSKVYSANPFWYPRTETVLTQVRKVTRKAG
jgi:hypothetical protein